MQLLCDKYTYIIYMCTMVSPTFQSEKPELSRADRADNRWLASAHATLGRWPETISLKSFEAIREGEDSATSRRNDVRWRRSRDRLSTLGSVHGFAHTLQFPGNPEKNVTPKISPVSHRSWTKTLKSPRNTSVEFNHINYERRKAT